jgi:Probable zinc-ribbon domain
LREGLTDGLTNVVGLSQNDREKRKDSNMKSNKQRRAEIKARRSMRASKKCGAPGYLNLTIAPCESAPVNRGALVRYNSYGMPEFEARGFYMPVAFTCRDCGVNEVWTAKQQKLWYEDWQGPVFSVALRCRPCRALAREAKLIAIEKTKQGLVNHENKKQNR